MKKLLWIQNPNSKIDKSHIHEKVFHYGSVRFTVTSRFHLYFSRNCKAMSFIQTDHFNDMYILKITFIETAIAGIITFEGTMDINRHPIFLCCELHLILV